MAKKTGIIRKIDLLGRLVLPAEFRKVLGIDLNDDLEMTLTDEGVLIKKYENKGECILCGSKNDLVQIPSSNKPICKSCADNISKKDWKKYPKSK